MIAEHAPALSLYDGVRERLAALVPVFGLDETRETILRAFDLACSESLDLPAGRRPLHPSRLNADGTPFQLALTLGSPKPPLQFVSETGPLGAANPERLLSAREAIRRLAGLFACENSVALVFSVLDEAAPIEDADLLVDEAGAVWIGAAFPPGRSSRLKVYVNAKWGREEARWQRLARFAADVGVAGQWDGVRELLPDALEPLGLSVTVCGDAPTAARIYLSGYGERFGLYETLADAYGGPDLARRVREFAQTLLRDDYRHPSRSAVCSFGVQSGSFRDLKLELCAHCAFDSDVHASRRCLDWLGHAGIAPDPYLDVVGLLSAGRLGDAETRLHSYVGIQLEASASAPTFYLNPSAGLH